jgi:hypothetical protein
MTTIACAGCQTNIDENDSFMTGNGAVCGICHTDAETTEMGKKGLFSFENIMVLVLGGAAFSFSLVINGMDYGAIVMGALALIGAAFLMATANKNQAEPSWLRYGRPAILLLVGTGKIAGALL